MSFSQEQIGLLSSKLDGSKVATRTNGRMQLSYIEGFHAIEEANRIFGFDGWSYRVVDFSKVSEEKNNNGNHVIGYQAVVEVVVYAGDKTLHRQDVGYGSGIAKDLFSAFEGAGKEAVTDALKRALRTFGNPFGLALYDKKQVNVDYENTTGAGTNTIVEDATQRFHPKAITVVDYKAEIAGFMTSLGIKDADIPACAQAVIAGKLDIANNPRDIWLNRRADLKEIIEIFKGFAE